ncbi:MAG TPA: TonB-dependent receptor [Planctomycetota bacterium]|nr:TonB-dependent receptor [Planctomycetota bacterium]
MFRTLVPYCCCGSGLLPLPLLVAQEPPQQPDPRLQALERALQESAPPPASTPGVPAPSTPGQLRLIDVSLDVVAAVGSSTASDAELRDLQGGGHDPKKRGFTLEQAELSLGGAVDPYFTAESHIVWAIDPDSGDSEVELEEAFLTSQALPYGLQAKSGLFFTEFGRLNPVHPHAWDWQDQPIILTRVFGGDGMRAPGARLSWLLPTEHYNEVFVTVQNANGEQMTSFLANEGVYEERPIGGRDFAPDPVRSFGDLVYTGRLVSSWDISDASSTAIGASVAYGPNATGNGADTLIYGADFVYKWRAPSNERGWPFFRLQGEVVARDFAAADQIDAGGPLAPVTVPGTTLHDYGAYLQALWGFSLGWDAGLRGEWVSGSGDSYDAATAGFARASDPYRCDRYRISPLLEYHPSEFSRFRLQYSYDDTDVLAHPAHSVWFGFELLIGKHPPHKY